MDYVKIKYIDEIDTSWIYYIYGSGITGQVCLKVLEENKCQVNAFIDDNILKRGTVVKGKKVISYQDFINSTDINRPIGLVLGSIYVGMQLRTIEQHGYHTNKNVTVLDVGALVSEKDEACAKMFIKTNSVDAIMEKIQRLYDICLDEESCHVIDVMKMVYRNQYYKQDVYSDICSKEPQYFIDKIMESLKNKKANIISGGAYHGEIISDFLRYGVEVNKVWLFEADKKNYNVMLENIIGLNWQDKCVPINKGLWDDDAVLYLDGDNDTCKVVDYKTDNSIEVVALDKIIDDHIDFIMMDIEGAEQFALRGGKNLIIHDRPILAICIYHSPEDFVEIPVMLREWLDDYQIMIKHHTNTYVESIVYAVPNK